MTIGGDDPAQATAWWLGQDGDRLLMLTGWIGTHPGTGEDVAHLMLHPAGHGAAEKMRTLAGAIGAPRAEAGPLTDLEGVSARANESEVELYLDGDRWLRRPVNPEWSQAAHAQGYVILTIGVDGFTGRLRDLDRYLDRTHRLYLARIPLTR